MERTVKMQRTERQDIEAIMQQLDGWVKTCGSGRYVPQDFVSTADSDFSLAEDFGIQQVREEIREFAALLLSRQRLGRVLEIGLGYFGSTHFLWRLLFDQVSTIEYQKDRVFLFRENCRRHFGKHVLDDGKSSFFFGSSSAPSTLRAVYDQTALANKSVDLLFIDGDHRYEGVLADWLLYSHLVSPGGLVAFHDAVAQISGAGVPRLLEQLSAGTFDGVKRDIKRIVSSKDCGIAYYIQPERR
jgi:predicted O-methyltransferase YrrM